MIRKASHSFATLGGLAGLWQALCLRHSILTLRSDHSV